MPFASDLVFGVFFPPLSPRFAYRPRQSLDLHVFLMFNGFCMINANSVFTPATAHPYVAKFAPLSVARQKITCLLFFLRLFLLATPVCSLHHDGEAGRRGDDPPKGQAQGDEQAPAGRAARRRGARGALYPSVTGKCCRAGARCARGKGYQGRIFYVFRCVQAEGIWPCAVLTVADPC